MEKSKKMILAENAILLNELYLRKVSDIDTKSVNAIVKTSLAKKENSFSKKFEHVSKITDLSQKEKIAIERKFNETRVNNAHYNNKSITTMDKRNIKTIDGALIIYYTNASKDVVDVYAILRNKKTGGMATKRLFWRLHNNKKTVPND